MQIQVEGRAAAEAWKDRARVLNESTERTMNEVSRLLREVNTFAEGTLVDEIVDFGHNVMTATTSLMSGMNKIFDVVNNLLNILANLFTGASQNTQNSNQWVQ